MTPNGSNQPLPVHPDAPRALIDANVFGRRQWMSPLLAAARLGRVQLFWSPAIIAEASRVLLWLHIWKNGGTLSASLRLETSDLAKRWFQVMSAVFHVVEDRPPHEPLWAETLSDEDDRPIWSAAIRAGADAVVTLNLRDGPPADADGLRVWDGLVFMEPDTFIHLLEWWPRSEEGGSPEDDASFDTAADVNRQSSGARFARMVEFLRTTGQLPPREPPASDAEA